MMSIINVKAYSCKDYSNHKINLRSTVVECILECINCVVCILWWNYMYIYCAPASVKS